MPNARSKWYKLMGNRTTLKQLVSFGAIGALNTGIDVAVFALLVFFHMHYAVAQLVAYSAGMANSYLLNRAITFRTETAKRDKAVERRRRLRFLLWNGSTLALSIALLAVTRHWLMWNELAAKAVVTVLIVGINFYGSKKWVFAVKPAAKMGG
ncbi:GtrA family protein [Paenibacillus sp. PL2-23]|uniref:GtrA family protein n=1 Tax=Paenibacillus sp. PL2-23 TaxID=2100729 RepID=UPI0030F7ED5E